MKQISTVGRRIALSLIALSGSISAQAQRTDTSKNDIVLVRTINNAFPSSKIRPVVLPDGRMVVSVADTVYMLAPNGDLIWRYATTGETLTSEPTYNAELNEIAVVGRDLLFVRLDATTGKPKWKAETVGRAELSSVVAYKKGYLVVVDMTGYRENDRREAKVRVPDQLEYWTDSEEKSWRTDFPIGAELIVSGNRIYSLIRSKDKVRLRELHAPQTREKQP